MVKKAANKGTSGQSSPWLVTRLRTHGWGFLAAACIASLGLFDFVIPQPAYERLGPDGYLESHIGNLNSRAAAALESWEKQRSEFVEKTMGKTRRQSEVAQDILSLNVAQLKYLAYVGSSIPFINAMADRFTSSDAVAALEAMPQAGRNELLYAARSLKRTMPEIASCEEMLQAANKVIIRGLTGNATSAHVDVHVAMIVTVAGTMNQSNSPSWQQCQDSLQQFDAALHRLVATYPAFEDESKKAVGRKLSAIKVVRWILIALLVYAIDHERARWERRQ